MPDTAADVAAAVAERLRAAVVNMPVKLRDGGALAWREGTSVDSCGSSLGSNCLVGNTMRATWGVLGIQ